MVYDHINLITGADGFIGSSLCREMVKKGKRVRGTVRSSKKSFKYLSAVDMVPVGDISRTTDWRSALFKVDTVIHLAGMAHVVKGGKPSSYYSINTEGTEALAGASAKAGVRRFIYISSIGVNGERSPGRPFREEDIPHPCNAYAVSKLKAEEALCRISKNTGMEVVIIRPPLVYGPNAPGNYFRLMSLIQSSVPLPLRSIQNMRSLIYVDNLISAILICIDHPKAAGEIYLVSDGQDISTPNLIRLMAAAMDRKPFLFSLHPGVLRTLCRAVGKVEEFDKMIETLIIDSSKIRNMLGWTPPFTLEQGINKSVKEINYE